MPTLRRPLRRRATAVCLLALLAGARVAVAAEAPQLHGFAMQGYALSEGNDVLGHSREGSFEYYEVGVNALVPLRHDLTAAAQLVARRAGEVDDGSPRLDYALLDWRALERPEGHAGLRAGRVKLPFGLYNETRDMPFTRPGILLPDSVYSDLSGQQRGLLFSADGAQLHAGTRLGLHELSLVVTGARDRDLDHDERRLYIDLDGLPFGLRIENLWQAQLLDEIDGGRWQFAFSHFGAGFDLTTDPAVGLRGRFDIDAYVLSAQYNAARWSLTGEYAWQRSGQVLQLGGASSHDASWSDGGYAQLDYRLQPAWTAMLRLDASFADRDHRRDEGCAQGAATGDRHDCYSIDAVAGLRWQPDEHWALRTEVHHIDGRFKKYALVENREHDPQDHWNLLLFTLGYRF